MEDTLGVINNPNYELEAFECLNPCFNGRYSRRQL